MNTVTENWLPVVGYERLYEVSDLGRVRSLDRWVIRGDGTSYKIAGRMRAICTNGRYCHVGLSGVGVKQTTRSVHRLVCEAFIGPRPANFQINHRNGVKTDNRLANLEYVSPRENSIHAYRNGLSKAREGERHHWAKLTAREAALIRANHAGLTPEQLATVFQVSLPTVYDVQSGRSWKSL